MAFKRLSTKLAVMYGGLFSAALLVIAIACYMAVISYARVSVQKELQANAEVFKRIWTLNSEALQTNAGLLSRDFGFKQALATHDKATVAKKVVIPAFFEVSSMDLDRRYSGHALPRRVELPSRHTCL